MNELYKDAFPDSEGVWELIEAYKTEDFFDIGLTVEVYHLEPANNQLCVWCEDVGMGSMTHSCYWDSDEFFGHVPVCFLYGVWKKIE